MYIHWGRLYKGTPAELAIEPAVAAIGLAYRTNLPGFLFGFRFFPDVFIPQLGLVIEVDDSSHNKADKIAADAERTSYLVGKGWRVARCTNKEALEDPHGTVQGLLRAMGITPAEIERAKRKPLVECLPVPGKCPRKERRDAKVTRRRAARGDGEL